jgi:hypothetical protein
MSIRPATFVVKDGVWTWSRASLWAAAEAEMEAVLRERFGDDHPLLTPGLFRGACGSREHRGRWATT